VGGSSSGQEIGYPLYTPYDAPFESSQAFAAWQFSRALEAEHGVRLDADMLPERDLETRRNGQLDIHREQVSRNLELHEAGDTRWYGSMGTLVSDHPELAARWDARRAALPVLCVAALVALARVLKLRLRLGKRLGQVLTILLPSAIGIALVFSMGTRLWFGAGRPQVLFAVTGDGLLSWLPDNAAAVWAIAALAAAYEVLARALERAEQPMRAP